MYITSIFTITALLPLGVSALPTSQQKISVFKFGALSKRAAAFSNGSGLSQNWKKKKRERGIATS
jgi:hypothetical protein